MKNLMFVGTYTSGSYSDGIYSFLFDEDFKTVVYKSTQPICHNPSWLVLHPTKNVIYALDDSSDQGGFYAYSYCPKTGEMTNIGCTALPGARGSCHAVVTRNGKFILIANYYSGNFFVCRLREDGSIGEVVTKIQHTGSSVRKDHQDSAHAHHILLDETERFLTVCELGADKLMLYLFDSETGEVRVNEKMPSVAIDPEQGPRHAVFHPSGKWFYLVTELGCCIYTFEFNPQDGTVKQLQKVSTLRDSFRGHSTAGEILITKDGRHILATNRWYDSIVEFDVDAQSGLLSNRRFFSSLGGEPRHISLTPDERFISICNQDTRNLVIRPYDPESGEIDGEQFETFVWKPAFSLSIPAED